jgi:hypothetical protein
VTFASGTSYNKGMVLGESFAQVPMVPKPYHRSTMITALMRLAVPDQAVQSAVDEVR